MDRRSPRQKAIDDAAFPVRVRALVSERGFENLLPDIDRWLGAEVGRGNYAGHSARSLASDATAWYFRCVGDARSKGPGRLTVSTDPTRNIQNEWAPTFITF